MRLVNGRGGSEGRTRGAEGGEGGREVAGRVRHE